MTDRRFVERKTRSIPFRPAALLAAAISLVGCASSHVPYNAAGLYAPEAATRGTDHPGQIGGTSAKASAACPSAGTSDFIENSDAPHRRSMASRAMRYSIGDRFNIFVSGYEDISGDYMINTDGRIMLPFAGEVSAVGATNDELQRLVEGAYLRAGILKEGGMRAVVRPVQ